jgi:hypothetical protein
VWHMMVQVHTLSLFPGEVVQHKTKGNRKGNCHVGRCALKQFAVWHVMSQLHTLSPLPGEVLQHKQ